MANYPNASLTVNFQTTVVDGDGNLINEAYLAAEVVAEDNADKSSFVFGDQVKYRVYKTPNITDLLVTVSDGADAHVASGLSEEMSEVVAFSGTNVASVSKYIFSLASAIRLGGQDLGAISIAGPTAIKCSRQSAGLIDPLVGVYQLSYTTRYNLRKLFNVAAPAGFGLNGFTSYPVMVYLVGIVGDP